MRFCFGAGRFLAIVVRLNLIQPQESVAIGPIVNKGSVKAGLNFLNNSFIDVAAGFLFVCGLNGQFIQNSVLNQGYSALLRVDNVYDHFFGGICIFP